MEDFSEQEIRTSAEEVESIDKRVLVMLQETLAFTHDAYKKWEDPISGYFENLFVSE